MQFYCLKTREHVDIPDSKVTRTEKTAVTKGGRTRTVYMLQAVTPGGDRVTRIVSKSVYDALK